jgi:hypothetical protein
LAHKDRRAVTFEFRIPILPRAPFFSNVKLAALSLSKLGGDYAAAPIKVSMGEETSEAQALAANSWAAGYPIVWRSPKKIWPCEVTATIDRYSYEAESDVVILMDADACLVRPIDELIAKLRHAERPTVAGVMAHFPPFKDWATSEAEWRKLLAVDGYADPPLDFTYSMAPPERAGRSPPYFNYGFVAFNAAAFELLRNAAHVYIGWMLEVLEGTKQQFFAAQIGLTLGLLATDVDVISLGPEYNCTNSDEMLGYGVDSVENIRVIHYLRTDAFDRNAFLCRRNAFDAFQTATFASPVLRLLQRHVLSLPDVFYDEGEAEVFRTP